MAEKRCNDCKQHTAAKGMNREKEMATVPFAALDMLKCICDGKIKRLRVVLSVVVAMLVASNAAWIIYAL